MGRIQKWCTQAYSRIIQHAPYHIRIGKRAERIAKKYLIRQGLNLIDCNYHCKHGEIDLIMADEQTIVFVEVRLRTDGCAIDSVNYAKQQRIACTASHYMTQHPVFYAWATRFDIVALSACNTQSIQWSQNAFAANIAY